MAAIRCPHCGHQLVDENAAYQHIKARHGARSASQFRPAKKKVRQCPAERESSIADEHLEAMLAAACGEEIAFHIAEMFPDDFDDRRRQREEAA